MYKQKRLFGVILLAGALALLAGCYGRFPLTRTVYQANGNVYASVPGDSTQRKLVQSVVMWLFIPVYLGAAVADAAVFNVIEFWTGRTTAVSSVQDADGTTVALEPDVTGREAMLTVSRDGAIIARERLVKVSDSILEIRDTEGGLKGTLARLDSGAFEIRDPAGNVLQTVARK